MLQKLFLFLLLTFLLPATCLAVPTMDQFDRKFQEALPLCEELALPNSMARKPGFDIKSIETELHKRSDFFSSDEGSRFLINRIKTEQDTIYKQCAERLLKDLSD